MPLTIYLNWKKLVMAFHKRRLLPAFLIATWCRVDPRTQKSLAENDRKSYQNMPEIAKKHIQAGSEFFHKRVSCINSQFSSTGCKNSATLSRFSCRSSLIESFCGATPTSNALSLSSFLAFFFVLLIKFLNLANIANLWALWQLILVKSFDQISASHTFLNLRHGMLLWNTTSCNEHHHLLRCAICQCVPVHSSCLISCYGTNYDKAKAAVAARDLIGSEVSDCEKLQAVSHLLSCSKLHANLMTAHWQLRSIGKTIWQCDVLHTCTTWTYLITWLSSIPERRPGKSAVLRRGLICDPLKTV